MSDKNEPLNAAHKKCLERKVWLSWSLLRTRKTDFLFVLLVQNSSKFNQEKATKPHSFQWLLSSHVLAQIAGVQFDTAIYIYYIEVWWGLQRPENDLNIFGRKRTTENLPFLASDFNNYHFKTLLLKFKLKILVSFNQLPARVES